MEWQPIETAPRNGEDIIVCDISAKKPRADIAHFYGGQFVACSSEVLIDMRQLTDIEDIAGHIGFFEPTHWMQLPEPPK